MKKYSSLMPLAMLVWHCQSMALEPASYKVDLEVHFNRGEIELPELTQHRLEELASHLDDFRSPVIYVVAHGDVQKGDAVTDEEKQIGSARAGVVTAIFSRRAIASSARIHTYTESVQDLEHEGLVEIVIKGYCGPGYAICDEHWTARAH